MSIQRCPNCQAEIKAGTQVCPLCGYAFPFATDMLDAGRVLQNRYELVKLIHSGGMGYIYLALDKRLDREVVVKQVRQPVKSDAHRKKLEEEALRMAQLSHPAVAMVFNHFVEYEFYFLVVEYIKGHTLTEIFEKSDRSLQESLVIDWMVQVCEVIGYLHDKGMVHRDISPDNIMLTQEGHIKLIDFGTLHDLSMIVGKKAGKEGKFGFTPKEQWDGNPVPQSDVFAIGATAYYLLTGYLPISEQLKHGGTPQEEDFAPVYPPLKEKRPDLSDGLETVLGKALCPEYISRYGEATDLGAYLQEFSSCAEQEAPTIALVDKLNINIYQQVKNRIETTAKDIFRGVVSYSALKRRPKWLLPVIFGSIALLVLMGAMLSHQSTYAGSILYINGNDIYVYNVKDGSTSKVTNDNLNKSYISWKPPTYEQISFMSRDMAGRYQIYTTNLDGSGKSNLTNDIISGDLEQYSYLPDGNKISYLISQNGKSQLFIMNSDGSGKIPLTDKRIDVDRVVGVSPDGTKIAFSVKEDEIYPLPATDIDHFVKWVNSKRQLFVMDIDGSNILHLADYNGFTGIKWSPNSKKIFYDSYVVNSDGKDKRQLTDKYKGALRFPEWAPDGEHLAFITLNDNNILQWVLISSDGSSEVILVNNNDDIEQYDWSPDGKKITYTTSSHVYFINTDGSNKIQLTPNEEKVFGQPTFSPDGKRILYGCVYDKGDYQYYYIVNTDGSNKTLIGRTSTNEFIRPIWSPQ